MKQTEQDILALYLAQPMQRDSPALDQLIAVLSERPGLTRAELQTALHLSYWGLVDLLARAARAGWIGARNRRVEGCRSVLAYDLRVPPRLREGGACDPPPAGAGSLRVVALRARAEKKKHAPGR